MCVYVWLWACSLSGAVYIRQAKSCNLIPSFLRGSSTPPPQHTHTHTQASTSQHWELLEETRCYLTKTCWRQCVWVRRAVGIVDTLLPYVHPGCSPSAGLISADFLQKFLQGNRSLTITEQMAAHAEWICVSPKVLALWGVFVGLEPKFSASICGRSYSRKWVSGIPTLS